MRIKLVLDVNLLMIRCFVSTRKGEKYFKPLNVVCPECNSHDVVKNGTYSRKLIFLINGEQNCIVQKYKCI